MESGSVLIEISDDEIDFLRYLLRIERKELVKKRERLGSKFGGAADLSHVDEKIRLTDSLKEKLG